MEFYHVLNRGVDKREIFLDKQDKFRFIHDLFEFNNQDKLNTTSYIFNKNNDIECRNIVRRPRKLLVKIHAFCMMPNHYHLLLSQMVEGGVSKFMKKINMGYAKYFNEKYKRSGALFQGRYKNILIKNDAHFIYLPHYIHLNPLDLISPKWRDGKINSFDKAAKFLESYRWSSFLDYIGIKNFPSITQRDFLGSCLGGKMKCKKDTYSWLKEIKINKIRSLLLE